MTFGSGVIEELATLCYQQHQIPHPESFVVPVAPVHHLNVVWHIPQRHLLAREVPTFQLLLWLYHFIL